MGTRVSKLKRIIGDQGGVKRLRGHPSVTPRGYIPVCVGVHGDTKRFIIHTTALGNPDILELLYRSAEEYGFCNEGILRIPYEAKEFEEWLIRRAKPKSIRVKPNLAF